MTTHRLKLPISGMTCAACAFTIERALTAPQGVAEVYVNRAPSYANIRYDPEQVSLAQLVQQVYGAGYSVGLTTIELSVELKMNEKLIPDIEAALAQEPGSLSVSVDVENQKVAITCVSGAVQRLNAVKALEDAGYSVFEPTRTGVVEGSQSTDTPLQQSNGSTERTAFVRQITTLWQSLVHKSGQ